MADAVNLASKLLEQKVVVHRPPSGVSRKNLSEEFTEEILNAQNKTRSCTVKQKKAEADRKKISKFRKNSQSNFEKEKLYGSVTDLSLLQDVPDLQSKKDHLEMQPSVYGIQHGRHIYGSEPDLRKVGQFPYKMSEDSPVKKADDNILANFKFKYERTSIPSTLLPLMPYLNEDISPEIIGMSPADCLCFIRSVGNMENLPVVPPPHSLEDDLPYKENITPKKPWNPKKYKHYFTSKPKREEWKCKHNGREVKIFSKDGSLIHERYQGSRTADIIRKEIEELEKLLAGVGDFEGNSIVVRYQADINHLRDMVDDTLSRVVKRDEPEEPVDHSGLRQFYKDHSEVIKQIKEQHDLCIQELAVLEAELDLDTDRQYFSKSRNNDETCEDNVLGIKDVKIVPKT